MDEHSLDLFEDADDAGAGAQPAPANAEDESPNDSNAEPPAAATIPEESRPPLNRDATGNALRRRALTALKNTSRKASPHSASDLKCSLFLWSGRQYSDRFMPSPPTDRTVAAGTRGGGRLQDRDGIRSG